jgi:hypothetical protein
MVVSSPILSPQTHFSLSLWPVLPIATVTPPANGVYSQVATLDPSTMSFVVNWSEAVNYSATGTDAAYMNMDVGGTTVKLQWAAGANQIAMTHRPTTLTGRNDADGVVVSSPFAGTAIIKDQAGNTANVFTLTAPTTPGITVDTTAPTVTTVTPITGTGTYNLGDTIDVSVTFNENITVLQNGSYPRIPVTIGSTTKYLVATANATSTTHTFRYTIVANDLDTDGIVLGNTVQSNGTTAYARDPGRNNVTGTFTPPSMTNIKVDAVLPTILSRTPSANKTYISGETVQISVTYSEVMTVDTTGGTPSINLSLTSGAANLVYATGSGTATLVFSRVLTGTDFDMDGLPGSVTTINLNGGTIQDAGQNNGPLTFTAVNLSSLYVSYPEVKVWVRSDFVNIAPPTGAATVTNGGSIDTRTCSSGSGTCRIFNGNGDILHLTSALGSVSMVYMVFETPSSVTGTDMDIFDTDITINDTFFNFDLATKSATITVDATTYNTNDTSHNTNFSTGETHVLQLQFQNPQSYSNVDLINNGYQGAIGEVIVIEGTLSTTEKNNIRNYLNGRY